MPLTITREAQVYRLWLDDDLRDLFASHAEKGWVCSLVAHPGDEPDTAVWAVRLQHNASKQLITATLEDVVVSDLVTVVSQTLDEYNAANPGDQIVEGS